MPSTIIGVDIGGTKSSIGLYGTNGPELLSYDRFPTEPARGFDAVLDDVLERVGTLCTDETVAVGVGVPGLVRQPAGTLQSMPNIPGGDGFPLLKTLQKRLGLPVVVENDSRCFALAEAVEGAGAGRSVVVGVTLGTGVGGGIVINGTIFHGSDGFAGELGHMLLIPGDPPYDTKDARGEVEQFLSGTAMRKRCVAAKKPEDLLEGDACTFLHPEIVREAAWLCASLTHMLNPAVIVFGGSTGKALGPYLNAIEEELTAWVLPGTPLPSLKLTTIPHAATRGAAILALRLLTQQSR